MANALRRNSLDRSVLVWDLESVSRRLTDVHNVLMKFEKGAILSNQIYQEAYACTAVRLHPHHRDAVIQSSGNYIAIFSLRRPYKLNKGRRFEGHAVGGYRIQCNFSPDGRQLASGSADGRAVIYDWFGGGIVSSWKAHPSACLDVTFHPMLTGVRATSSWDGEIRIWSLPSTP